jgi:hypothetical protein
MYVEYNGYWLISRSKTRNVRAAVIGVAYTAPSGAAYLQLVSFLVVMGAPQEMKKLAIRSSHPMT